MILSQSEMRVEFICRMGKVKSHISCGNQYLGAVGCHDKHLDRNSSLEAPSFDHNNL